MINKLFRLYKQSRIEPYQTKITDGLLDTKYGQVKMVKNVHLSQKQLDKITKIYYLEDWVGSNFIKSILKKDKESLIVFDCQKMHIRNAAELFAATKTLLNEQYFGDSKNPKNPFLKCQGPKEVFHLHRHILAEQKKQLSKICLHVAHNGDVRIQGLNEEINNLQYYLDDQNSNISEQRYKKCDYLLPYSAFQGMITALNYEKEGIQIEQLNNQKIYTLYGVWPPTQKQYLQLFQQYIQKLAKQHEIQQQKKIDVIDLGCGSGILGFLVAQALSKNAIVYGIDNVDNAVRSSKINAQSLELNKYRAELADICDPIKLEHDLKQYKFPMKYDLIIANPPWIWASKYRVDDPLENTSSDPEGQMLKSVFQFADKYLQIDTNQTNKGRLLLIYSDLSANMQLNDKSIIQDLCKKYKMIITQQSELPFMNKENSNVDPLLQYKQDSKVQLFEISKI